MHTVLNLDERTVDEFCESHPTCKRALFGPQAKDTAGGDRRADGEENRQHRRLKTVFLPLLAILVGLLLSTPRASAQTDSWPSVETVLADTHGTDPLDTAARQRAALMALSDMVRDSAGPKQTFNLPEPLRRQVQTYSAAEQVILNKTVAELDPPGAPKGKDSPRAKWYDQSSRYSSDPAFREALTQRYLNSKVATVVRQAQARNAAQRQNMAAQSMRDNQVGQEQQARKDSLWRTEMTALAMVLGTYVAAFVLLVTWRLMHRPVLPAHAPGWSFQAGGGGATFEVHTGMVTDHRKRSDTYVSSSGGTNNQAATISSNVVVVDEFLLKSDTGQADIPVRLSNVELLLFNGQRISVIQGANAFGNLSQIVRLVNHNSKQVAVTLGSNISGNWGLVWPWFLPSLLCLPVAAVVPKGGGALALLASGALCALAGLVWWINSRLVWSRLIKLLNSLAQQVLAAEDVTKQPLQNQ